MPRFVPRCLPHAIAVVLVSGLGASAADEPSTSLMASFVRGVPPLSESGEAHGLRDVSMFAIAPPEVRQFNKHDLVQIIVRESSRAESSHELETDKDYDIAGNVRAWPDLNLQDLLNLQVQAGRTTGLPRLGVGFTKGFKGEGDYEREDDLTARLTAEIIDLLPNGNLVLEARTRIRMDEEVSTMLVTGVCRQEDITPANTVLSSHIHDLEIDKVNEGELKKSNEKGIIARVLDTLFAF